MQYKSIQLENKNQLNLDYRAQHKNITSFFQYDPFGDYTNRLMDINKRTYKRQALNSILFTMNKKWGAPISTMKQIDRLKLENSVVVIGGQQAGLLTGPTYSLNKVISIIKLAREQEKALKIPVIPVFWIAGEDHDFEEVNHIFSVKEEKMYKHPIKQQQLVKKALSEMELDHAKTKEWLKGFLNDLQETHYSKEWFEKTIEALEASETYVDFFARLIFQLFPDHGLVLMDSHHPEVRKLESGYFKEFIENEAELNTAAYEAVQVLQQKGYDIPIDIEADDTNLFYHDPSGERVLLKRKDNKWVGKNEEVLLTTADMLEIATHHPEKLSNNVVTRPIMQEMLFPTLAFVGGDGEINYWATLKKAFEVLDLIIPPVMPRLSFTYISKRIVKLMKTRVVEAEMVVNHGLEDVKVNWLTSQSMAPTHALFAEAKQSIAKVHLPLREYTATVSADLHDEARRNLQYLEVQIDYLKQKTHHKLEEIYQIQLDQFDEISRALHPKQGLQERIWNPFCFVNEYGYFFIDDLLNIEELSFTEQHFLIYLDE